MGIGYYSAQMKVNDELYVLQLPMSFNGVDSLLNLSLISSPEYGLTLVDTGLPGQVGLIEEALKAEGFSLSDVKQIVLTHQDIDHVGSLHALKEKTGVPVYALAEEVPYIDGTLPPIKMPPPEMIEKMPALGEMLKLWKPVAVDVAVSDWETLEKVAGSVVVATPGHTPGHMCLFLPGTKTLIAGDAMVSDSGTLHGPMAGATPDMESAVASVKKLTGLDVKTIVCYHGGLVTENAGGQLAAVCG